MRTILHLLGWILLFGASLDINGTTDSQPIVGVVWLVGVVLIFTTASVFRGDSK